MKFEFIIDPQGKKNVTKEETDRLVNYFLACLTIPSQDLWVNFSPYEQNRIIPEQLSYTDLGKDMLSQDYILKQLSSSLTYPETELGKKYWDAIRGAGSSQSASVNNFNKVWIVPVKAEVCEKGNAVFITGSRLKVMTEEDYLAMQQIEVMPEDQGQVSVTQTAHKRNQERLRRILKIVAESPNNTLPEDAPENAIVEFIAKDLLTKGFAVQQEDADGNIIVKIKPSAAQNKLFKALMKLVIHPHDGQGAKSTNLQLPMDGVFGGRWLIIGMEDELNNPRILQHEQREIFYRKTNPGKSWIWAHNMTVNELGYGVLIDDTEGENAEGDNGKIGMIFGWGTKGKRTKQFAGPIVDLDSVQVDDGSIITETDMTLDYGGIDKWNLQRILIDLVQNHKPADARGSRIDVVFHLRDGGQLRLGDSKLAQIYPHQVEAIEIADDGIGYDHAHLKYFLTTKGSAEEGGKFGEGLKIATAAALSQRMRLEFQSRDWQAVPTVVKRVLNRGQPNEISTGNIVFKVTPNRRSIRGSRTIIHNPSAEVFETARGIGDLVISLRTHYKPLVHIDGVGAIVERSQGQSKIYVKGNYVLTIDGENWSISVYPALFSYDIFDDEKLNRDRDNLPGHVVNIAVLKLLVKATPDIINTLIDKAQEEAAGGERFMENHISDYGLRNIPSEDLIAWKDMFIKKFGKKALIVTTEETLSREAKEQAEKNGYTLVRLSGTVYSILLHAGIATPHLLYYERKAEVKTGVALDYRQKAWGINRDVTKLDGFSNRDTWRKAWASVVKQKKWNPKKVVLMTRSSEMNPDNQPLLRNMGYTLVVMDSDIAAVIHSLGVHYDHEILHPEFEYVENDSLSSAELKVLALRKIIDQKLSTILGIEIVPSQMKIFDAVRSKLTGEELNGWHGYWDGGHIGIARKCLADPFEFGMTYLEEMGHRLSQAGDYTREFTNFFRNAFLMQIFQEQGLPTEGVQLVAANAGKAPPAGSGSLSGAVTELAASIVPTGGKSDLGGIALTEKTLQLGITQSIKFKVPLETALHFQNAKGLKHKILLMQHGVDMQKFIFAR